MIRFRIALAAGLTAAAVVTAPAAAAADVDPWQATSNTTAAWLSTTLGYDVPAPTVRVNPQVHMQFGGDAAVHFRWMEDRRTGRIHHVTSHVVHVAPLMAWRLGEAQRRPVDARAIQGMIHELLHRPDTLRADVGIEEGVVDAVAVDLTPAWCWQHWRTRCAAPPTYRGHVAAIRAASAVATGSPSWRTRDARLWRRALLAADHEGRQRMLAAGARRGAR